MRPERRAALLDAALKVFAQKGYRGATSRAIAEAAGITPGTIYWYFKNKEDLLRAVIRERSPVPSLMAGVADNDRPPEQVIPELMERYVRGFEQPMVGYAFRIILGEAGRHPELVQVLREEIVGRMVGDVAGYLQEQMKRGRIRRANLAILPMVIMGPLVLQAVGRFVLGLDLGPGGREELVKTASQAILCGILVDERQQGKYEPGHRNAKGKGED